MAALAEIDLEAGRVEEDDRGPADVDRVGLIVVHPDRVDPSVVAGEAWHFTSRQMHHLVDEPIGWREAPAETGEERATARGAAGEEVAA
jgi:hypothetical protein